MRRSTITLYFTLAFFIVLFECKLTAAGEENRTAPLPQGKILNFLDEDDEDLEGRVGNKSTKILTRPVQPTTTTQNPPHYGYPYQYSQYPQNPGYFTDSSAQGSGNVPSNIRPPPNHVQQQQQQHAGDQSPSGIPEIYVQLIGAIEKLVGRIDKLETRVKTVENILYHTTNKKPELPEQGSCPNNFKKVEGVRGKCFQVSSFQKSPMIYDWKSAENECTKAGGRLVEMLNYDDFIRVAQFLVKYSSASNSATSDFWIGGINPGLIWIWAESGQPVDMNKRFWNDNDNGSAAPGCLKLSYSHRLNTYFFKHSPCGHSQNYLCEILDNTVSRALAHFEEQLWTESEARSMTNL